MVIRLLCLNSKCWSVRLIYKSSFSLSSVSQEIGCKSRIVDSDSSQLFPAWEHYRMKACLIFVLHNKLCDFPTQRTLIELELKEQGKHI